MTGALGDDVIGYALGFTLPAGSGWWRGLRSDATDDETTETGSRTFALTEIMVRAPWRRRHYARELHDALLADRQEQRATLLVLPDNTPARSAYLSWNWHRIGELQPFDDAPVYGAMMRPCKINRLQTPRQTSRPLAEPRRTADTPVTGSSAYLMGASSSY